MRDLRGWRVIGNVAYVDAHVSNDSDHSGGSGNAGHRLPNLPRNAASLWNTYQLQDTAPRGLKFGAGVVMRDQREGDLNNGIQLPGYATVDLMPATASKWEKPN